MFKNQSIQPTAGFYSEGIATNFLNEKKREGSCQLDIAA
jgi:hypothetical protein